MKLARSPQELGEGPRAVALGTFDGVHLGHRRVIETALEAGSEPTVVTFDPHPRTAFGNRVELLTTLERRLELLEELGVEAALVVEFTLQLARLEPEQFAEEVLRPIGADVVVAGADFRFGRGRTGDLELLSSLGFDVRPVPLVEGVSSSRIRDLVRAGDVEGAAKLLGRPLRHARWWAADSV
jgi:riboflavin kinase/FMN adenylyltransferase